MATSTEVIDGWIMDQFRTISDEKNTIKWYETYNSLCDEVVFGMYDRKTWSLNWMAPILKAAQDMPKYIQKSIKQLLYKIEEPDMFYSGPRSIESITAICKRVIPLREQLIKKLRKARDDGTGKMLLDFSLEQDGSLWSSTSCENKEKAKEAWIDICTTTIDINRNVLFMNKYSSEIWIDTTRKWAEIIAAKIL